MNSIITVVTFQVVLLFVEQVELVSLNVTNPEEFQAALIQASPGDTITLLPILYVGNFTMNNSGVEEHPIYITGTQLREKHTIISSGGYGRALDINANFVQVENMALRESEFAVEVRGHHNLLRNLEISYVKNGAIITGNHNLIENCQVQSSNVGVFIAQGEGNSVTKSHISSLSISPGACCGNVVGSKIDTLLDMQGSRYNINSIMVAGITDIRGCGNVLNTYMFKGMSNIADCNQDNFRHITNLLRNFG